ncbi:MAG: ribonuclease M5 [Selenomonadaceae bacterium]|nr:ribonuclease M5 [Selenomonadaceae bacterium]MBR3746089.1 ribonuclease M5 [Selenomonadaceae bacterium]
MLKEVLIVEGKSDTAAVRRAVEADCITTGGFHFTRRTLQNIAAAYKQRGIIILTDPDSAGENIRKFLTERFPNAKHAYIPRDEATANDDIGVEQASPEAIRNALAKVRTLEINPREEFTAAEMVALKLSGGADSSKLRDKIGAALGIGYGNVKTFVRRLNSYGVTRAEFLEALKNVTSADS